MPWAALYGPTAAARNGRVVVPSRGRRVVARGRAIIEATTILDHIASVPSANRRSTVATMRLARLAR